MQSNFQQNGMNPSLKHMGSHTISNTSMRRRADDILQRVCLSTLSLRRRKSFVSPITPKTMSLDTSVPTKDLLLLHSPLPQASNFANSYLPYPLKSQTPITVINRAVICRWQNTQAKSMRNGADGPAWAVAPGQSRSSWTECKVPQRLDKTPLPRAWLCAPVLGPQSASMR